MSNADPLHHLHELRQQHDSLKKTLKDASLRNGIREIIEMVMTLTHSRVGVLFSGERSAVPDVVVGLSHGQLAESELGDIQSLQTLPSNAVVHLTDEVLSREAHRRSVAPDRRIVRACIAGPVPSEHLQSRTSLLLGRDDPFTKDDEVALSRAADCIAVALDHELLLRAVRQDEHRFRALLENSSEGIVVVSPEGVVRYISPAVTRIEGFTPEEIIGTRGFDRTHPDDLENMRKVHHEIANRKGEQRTVTVRHRHKNGSWVWLEAIVTNLLHDPAVGGIVANYRDVTQRKRAEEAMLLSQKMEALGRLAGGIAHDFNNLLLAISGNASLALADTAPDHPARESLDQILSASHRASDLVKQILAYSRQQETKREAVDFKATVEEALRLLRPAISSHSWIRFTSTPDVPHIYADASQIIQIIINLVTNASHALPEGRGIIEVKLESHTQDADTAMNEGDAVQYAKLIVRDNGSGMSAETLAQIFDPFFTTKRAGQGTGLGLSVVHGIVKAHGGKHFG